MRQRAVSFAARLRDEYAAGRDGTDPADDVADADTADEVAEAVRSIDWGAVRTATADRAGDAVSAARAMAAEVDWQRLQPVATEVSTALIAAVASGRLPIGGRLGAGVARAIVNDGMAQRVARQLGERLPDFSGVIDTTARDAPPADS